MKLIINEWFSRQKNEEGEIIKVLLMQYIITITINYIHKIQVEINKNKQVYKVKILLLLTT